MHWFVKQPPNLEQSGVLGKTKPHGTEGKMSANIVQRGSKKLDVTISSPYPSSSCEILLSYLTETPPLYLI